jgi:hypothetical protein
MTPGRHEMNGPRRTEQHHDRAIRLARARHSANGPSRDAEDGDDDEQARNQPTQQPRGLPDEEGGLQQASADHFGANPAAVLWAETAWLADATAKLKDIADQHFRRGEYAR